MKSTFRYGANFQIIGKTEPQKLSYAGAFSPVTGTLDDLSAHISKGHPWMPALLSGNGKRLQSHANHAEILGADIDGGMTIDQALEHPFVKAHCGLAIETASSKPEHHKFRLVFRLEKSLEDWEKIKIANRYLIEQLGSADPACKDSSRFFFGSPGRIPFLLNHDAFLPQSFVNDAIAWHQEQASKPKQVSQPNPSNQQSNQSILQGSTSLELVQQALSCIPPRLKGSGNYPECFQVLCGLVHEFGSERALELAEAWSPSDVDWDIAAKIAGMGSTDRPATIGSIFHVAKKYGFKLPKIEALQAEMNILRIEPTITATGRYIPKGLLNLPDKPGIILIDGTMGVGKTSSALKALVEQHQTRHPDGLQALFVPRNLLGIQAGEVLGLPHHSQTDRVDRMSLCLESLDKISPETMPDGVPLLIFDEVSQSLKQILEGNTCKGIPQVEVLARIHSLFREVKNRGGWIVLSEDGLTNLELDFVQESSGLEVVEYLKFTKEVKTSRTFDIFEHKSLVASEVFDRIERGENVCLFTDSKKYAEELERECKKRGIERCFFINSENSNTPESQAIASNPDGFIQAHKPRLLAFTPSMQSGISIDDKTGHFDAMGFYITHLEPRQAKQGCDRLRTDVPRFGYVKEKGSTHDEDFNGYDPEKIVEELKAKNNSTSQLIAFIDYCKKQDELSQTSYEAAGKAIDEALENPASEINFYLKFWSRYKARENFNKKDLKKNLISIWEGQGHQIQIITQRKDAVMVKAFKQNRKELDQETAVAWASADTSEIFLEQAREILNDSASTPDDRITALKRLKQEKLPGCNFDDVEFCLKAVIQQNGRFEKSAELLWMAQNPEAAKQLDRWNWSNAFSQSAQTGRIVIIHRLSNHSAQAKLLHECPLTPFIEGKVTEWDNNTDEAIAVHQWALLHNRQFRRHLRNTVSENHTPVQTVNKLLRKLGFEVKKQSRKGNRGDRQWQYAIVNLHDCDRDAIQKALTERFLRRCEEKGEQSVSPIRVIPGIDTSCGHGLEKWLTPDSLSDVREMWNSNSDPKYRSEVAKFVPLEALKEAIRTA